jgi:Tol biopolymer transport system component
MRVLRGFVALAVAALAILVEAAPAEAAYPARNGKIAFVRDGDIWTMRRDGTAQRRLTSYARTGRGLKDAGDPTWSPNGKRIAYHLCRMTRVGRTCDIWTMRADGTRRRQVTRHSAEDTDPAWSPDGRWIAFASVRPSGYGLYRIRATRPHGRPVPLAPIPECHLTWCEWWGDSTPDWSPDGRWIAFARLTNTSGSPSGNERWVEIVPAWDSDAPGRVVGVDRNAPTWSPDGSRIAASGFVWGDNPVDPEGPSGFNIVHMAPDGTDARRLTCYGEGGLNLLYARDPAWSPNGRSILYGLTSLERRGSAAWRVAADGARPPVLVARNAAEPDWQPRPRR